MTAGTIHLKIEGVAGTQWVTFAADSWDAWAPVTRVLKIHTKMRHITEGKPFQVLQTTRNVHEAVGL